MTSFERGDVVIVDLGVQGKIRPCVVLTIEHGDTERRLSIVAPLTTEIRGGDREVRFPKPIWLRDESVVNVLGTVSVENVRIIKRLAPFPTASLDAIYSTLAKAFGFRNFTR